MTKKLGLFSVDSGTLAEENKLGEKADFSSLQSALHFEASEQLDTILSLKKKLSKLAGEADIDKSSQAKIQGNLLRACDDLEELLDFQKKLPQLLRNTNPRRDISMFTTNDLLTRALKLTKHRFEHTNIKYQISMSEELLYFSGNKSKFLLGLVQLLVFLSEMSDLSESKVIRIHSSGDWDEASLTFSLASSSFAEIYRLSQRTQERIHELLAGVENVLKSVGAKTTLEGDGRGIQIKIVFWQSQYSALAA